MVAFRLSIRQIMAELPRGLTVAEVAKRLEISWCAADWRCRKYGYRPRKAKRGRPSGFGRWPWQKVDWDKCRNFEVIEFMNTIGRGKPSRQTVSWARKKWGKR